MTGVGLEPTLSFPNQEITVKFSLTWRHNQLGHPALEYEIVIIKGYYGSFVQPFSQLSINQRKLHKVFAKPPSNEKDLVVTYVGHLISESHNRNGVQNLPIMALDFYVISLHLCCPKTDR
jgi:hypothetical protein